MRGLISLCIVAFCAGLGVMVGNRMSSEAMAVVVGVVCGVLASIPMSVIMLAVFRTQQRGVLSSSKGRSVDERPPASSSAQYPPVVVVNPGGHQQLPRQDAGTVDGSWRALEPPRREFRVIGEE